MGGEKPGGCEVKLYPGVTEGMAYRYIHTNYANDHADAIINACLGLGLDPGYLPIFDRHLRDLHVGVIEDDHDQAETKALAHLTLVPTLDQPLHRRDPDSKRGQIEWKRVFGVGLYEIKGRATVLETVMKDLGIEVDSVKKLRAVAVDWLFAEQAMNVLGNTVYMQQMFDKYSPNLNCQSESYGVGNSVSVEAAKQGGIPERTVAKDFLRLQQGFGLHMLPASLLARQAVEDPADADLILDILRASNPDAHRRDTIVARLKAVHPKEGVRAAFAAHFSNYDFLDDEDDDDELS